MHSDHSKVRWFELKTNYPDQTLIRVEENTAYYHILRSIFHDQRFSRLFDDNFRPNTWATYIYTADEQIRAQLTQLLTFLKDVVYIKDGFPIFALDYHWETNGRTRIGELVYRAKPYSKPVTQQHKQNAEILSSHFVSFIEQHPLYQSADAIISVPYYGSKVFDLPQFIAQVIASKFGKPFWGDDVIKKIKQTPQLKNARSIQEKSIAIAGAFVVSEPNLVSNKSVVLIDDLYQSGVTFHEVASALTSCGADVFGLVATKTLNQFNSY